MSARLRGLARPATADSWFCSRVIARLCTQTAHERLVHNVLLRTGLRWTDGLGRYTRQHRLNSICKVLFPKLRFGSCITRSALQDGE